MPYPVYSSHGKQVLADGEPYADAINNEAATSIAASMNIPNWLDTEAECKKVTREFARTFRLIADSLRAKFHEPEESTDA